MAAKEKMHKRRNVHAFEKENSVCCVSRCYDRRRACDRHWKFHTSGKFSKTRDKNGRSFNVSTTPKFNEYFKLKGDLRSLMKQDIAELLRNSTTDD